MARTRLNKCHICGPGLSICCSLISVWGIVMLVSNLNSFLDILFQYYNWNVCHNFTKYYENSKRDNKLSLRFPRYTLTVHVDLMSMLIAVKNILISIRSAPSAALIELKI